MAGKIYAHPYQHAQHQLIFSWASSASVSQLVLLVHFECHSLYLALKKNKNIPTIFNSTCNN